MKHLILFCCIISSTLAVNSNGKYEEQTTRQIKISYFKKYNMIEWLRENFKENIIKMIGNNSNSLKQFQISILKGRNAECLLNKYGDLERYDLELNERNKENNALNYEKFIRHWNNLSATLEMNYNKEIVQYFNNMVDLKVFLILIDYKYKIK